LGVLLGVPGCEGWEAHVSASETCEVSASENCGVAQPHAIAQAELSVSLDVSSSAPLPPCFFNLRFSFLRAFLLPGASGSLGANGSPNASKLCNSVSFLTFFTVFVDAVEDLIRPISAPDGDDGNLGEEAQLCCGEDEGLNVAGLNTGDEVEINDGGNGGDILGDMAGDAVGVPCTLGNGEGNMLKASSK